MNISRFKNKLTSPRMGAVVFLVAGVVALWTCAMVGFTQEDKRETYVVNIRPGIVNYGTHSSATVPLVSAPQHRSVVPLISGNTVRSYAYSGHASAPAANTSAQIHTTSSASVKSVGSGSGGGGGIGGASSGISSGATPRRASNALGASCSAGVVPMPMMAMVSRSYATEVSVMGASTTADELLTGRTVSSGKMDVTPGNPGTPDGPIGPAIPVGATPWLLMLLFAAGYTLFLTKKSHQA